MSKQKLNKVKEEPVINLEYIATLIDNRQMAKLKKIFNESVATQIDLMFYYYNEKRWRLKSNQKIVFMDNEYIVVRAMRGHNEYQKCYYHAIWVIGIDDSGAWMHRLEWNHEFENDKMVWDKELIKKFMGFHESISEKIERIPKDKSMRLQGDLVITKRDEFMDYIINQKIEVFLSNYSYKYRELIYKRIEKEKGYNDAQIKILRDIEKWKHGNQEERKEIRKKYNLGNSSYVINRLHEENRFEAARKYRERRYKEIGADKILRYIEDSFKTNLVLIDSFAKKIKTGQVNFTIGNHLIIFSNANKGQISSWSTSNDMVIKDSSYLFVIHDEHQNKVLRLDSGVYNIRLLNRHRFG